MIRGLRHFGIAGHEYGFGLQDKRFRANYRRFDVEERQSDLLPGVLLLFGEVIPGDSAVTHHCDVAERVDAIDDAAVGFEAKSIRLLNGDLQHARLLTALLYGEAEL